MSKLPKNFEKILLGAGGVCAIGFGAMGFMKLGAVEADFAASVPNSGKSEIAIPGAPATAKAVSSLTSNRTIEIGQAGERPVNLFIGVPLFVDKNNLTDPVDPLEPGGRVVHPPIPNDWWIKTGANMTFADSPQRDDDSDGFSNLDEFEAKTDPVDAKSIPPLIYKLAYLKDESVKWYVDFGFESEGKWGPKLLGQTPDGKKFTNRVGAAEMLSPGDNFFIGKEPFLNRFKFTGIVQKEVTSKRTGLTQNVNVAEYEDLKPNKKGTKYQSQYGLPDAEIDANAYYDRTAVLDLQAIGEGGKQFKVEEGTSFALPPSATEKKYFLKTVTPEGIEVEYTEGTEKKSVSIPKGGTATK
jgi:hypothetical protein